MKKVGLMKVIRRFHGRLVAHLLRPKNIACVMLTVMCRTKIHAARKIPEKLFVKNHHSEPTASIGQRKV